MTEGYKALREGAAVLDLSGRGKIKAAGEDRVRLLHAMTTNSVEELKPGEGCYTLFLNAQGRILADADLFRFEDHLLLDTEPETREKVIGFLDRYIIADDVTLEDATNEWATIGVEGPKAGAVLAQAGAPLPEAPHATLEWNRKLVARADATGAGGYRVFAPASEREQLIETLKAAGAVIASPEDVRTVRIENGRPRYGEDLTEDYIPHETQLMRALHFNKGCYLGQEIVERVRSRGHVSKLLVQLRINTATAPEAGTRLLAEEDKEAGVITSAAALPGTETAAALGYVRTLNAKEGRELSFEGGTAVISGLSPG